MFNFSRGTSSIELKVSKLEDELMKRKEQITRLRRKVPKREIANHILGLPSGKSVKLGDLFGRKKELILIHNMGASCPYCTLWADGFNGVLKHLEDRAAFVLETPDSPVVQKRFAASRKWKFKVVSSKGTGFRKETGFQTADGDPMPGVSIFVKDAKGRIYQTSRTKFGPGDSYCNVWDLMDLLPRGAEGWGPKFRY